MSSPAGGDSVSLLSRLLDQVLDLPESQRTGWVDTLAPEYDTLKPRLRALLARQAGVESVDFLGTLPPLHPTTITAGQGIELDRLEPGALIGPYRLVRPIGAGGMGSVWLAQRADGLFDRDVALKLPHRELLGARLADRMARERRILASLDHPNIARLHDAGLTGDGQPYIAIEYIDGARLDAYCSARRSTVAERLGLFLQVAHAVAYAHAKLVVHRDLKPANILVAGDGQVRLLDFGIAKLLDDDTERPDAQLTQQSARALTPDYASPEQLAGAPVTIASDIYSLGVVLFELLTGARPYRLARATPAALETAILEIEPPLPSSMAADRLTARALRGDVDAIILKALQKDPADRYPTMHALADDIARHLAGQPVHAQPDRALYRIGRFLRRHKLAVSLAASIAVVLICASAIALWQTRVALAEQRRAQEIKQFIAAIFLNADPYEGGGNAVTASKLLQQASGRIDRDFASHPEIRVELLNTVGASLANLQDYDAAAPIVAAAVRTGRSELGDRHILTREARMVQLEIERFSGNTEQMRHDVDELLHAARRSADTKPAELVRLLIYDAHAALDEGKPDAAVRSIDEAMPLATAQLGQYNPFTVEAAVVQATAYRAAHKPVAAATAAANALQLSLVAYGNDPKHARVVDARLGYGSALVDAGQPVAAIREITTAIADSVPAYGSDSMFEGFASSHLARALLDSGELDEALRRTERSIALVKSDAAPRSFTMGAALALRGHVLLAAHRPREAEELLGTAASIYAQTLGPTHPATVAATINQAIAMAYLGKLEAAEALLGSLPEPGESAHWMSLPAAHALGIVKRLAAQPQLALAQQRAALTTITAGPRSKFMRMAVLAELGLSAVAAGEYQEAQTALTQSLQLATDEQSRVSAVRAEALLGMGLVHLHERRFAEAAAALRQSQDYWREQNPQSREFALTAWWLAQCQPELRVRQSPSASAAAALLSASPLPVDRLTVNSHPL